MKPAYPRIPYGCTDFETMRRERMPYVDKTRFVRELEEVHYAFLLRPRGFGKSCWVSLLRNYYDRNAAERFEALFAGTDIARRPTPDRNRYVILHFDFSAFGDTVVISSESFEQHCARHLRRALECNRDLFSETALQRILTASSIVMKLNELFVHSYRHDVPLYVLIDGYDFANPIPANPGTDAGRRPATYVDSFYRSFFATLKAGTERGGIERIFVTGVTPIAVDGVTGGFNIGTDVSLRPEFNESLGFTEPEVRGLLERYRQLGVFAQDVDEALAILGEWYGGYRFAEDAGNDLHHPTLVLHYLLESIPNAGPPEDLVDRNVRLDHGRLQRLLSGNRQLDDTYDLVRQLACEEDTVYGVVRGGFLPEELAASENLPSLLHYFGLLSIRPAHDYTPRLGIPNQTVRSLWCGSVRGG